MSPGKNSPLVVPGPCALPLALIVRYQDASQFDGTLEVDWVDRPFRKRLDRSHHVPARALERMDDRSLDVGVRVEGEAPRHYLAVRGRARSTARSCS